MTQNHAKFELIKKGIHVDCSLLTYTSVVILAMNYANSLSLLPPRS